MGNLNNLQCAELKILHEINEICSVNNIRYYLLGGTFLGAVRHKGFIPWDDDIDIGMPRKDFDKFLSIYKNSNSQKFDLISYKTNKTTDSYVPKLVNKEVSVIDNSAIEPSQQYAWVDIFPIDGMPNNIILRKLHSLKLLFVRLKINYSRFSKHVNIKKKGRPLIEKILIYIGRLLPVERIFDTKKELFKLDALLRKYNYENSKYVVNFMGAYKFKEMFPKKLYDDEAEYEFEDIIAKAPRNYDFILTQIYGDYMRLPDYEDRNHHNTTL